MKRTLSLLVAVLMVVALASAFAIGSAADDVYQLPTEYNGRELDWSVVAEAEAKPTYEDRGLNWLQVVINLYWGWEDLQTETNGPGGGEWMQSGEYFVSLDYGVAPDTGIDSESPYEVKVAGDAIIAALSAEVQADATVADAIGYYNFLADKAHSVAAGVHNDGESYYIFDVLDDLLRDAIADIEEAADAVSGEEPEQPAAELPDFFVEFMNTPFDFDEYVNSEAEAMYGGPFDLTTEDGYQIYLEYTQAIVDDYNTHRGAAISQVAVYRLERASFITDDIADDPAIAEFLSLLDQYEDIITGDTLYCYEMYTMPISGNSFDLSLQEAWNAFRTQYGFDGRIKNRNQNGEEYPEGTLPETIIMHPEWFTAESWEAFCEAYAKAAIIVQVPHVGADGTIDMIRELEAQRSSGGNYTYDTSKEIWAAYANLVILPSAETGDDDAQLAWNNNPGWAVDDTGASASTRTWVEIYNEAQAAYQPAADMMKVGDEYYPIKLAEFTPAEPQYPDNPDDPGNPDNPDNPDTPDDPQSPGTFDVSMVSGLVALASAASAAFVGLKKKK